MKYVILKPSDLSRYGAYLKGFSVGGSALFEERKYAKEYDTLEKAEKDLKRVNEMKISKFLCKIVPA